MGSRGEYDRAISDFDRAIQLDPDQVDAYRDRAIVWTDRKEFGEALLDLDRMLPIDPDIASRVPVAGDGPAGRVRTIGPQPTSRRPSGSIPLRLGRSCTGPGRASAREYDGPSPTSRAIEIEPARLVCPFSTSPRRSASRDREGVRREPRAIIDLQGWRGEMSAYAARRGHLASGLARDLSMYACSGPLRRPPRRPEGPRAASSTRPRPGATRQPGLTRSSSTCEASSTRPGCWPRLDDESAGGRPLHPRHPGGGAGPGRRGDRASPLGERAGERLVHVVCAERRRARPAPGPRRRRRRAVRARRGRSS